MKAELEIMTKLLLPCRQGSGRSFAQLKTVRPLMGTTRLQALQTVSSKLKISRRRSRRDLKQKKKTDVVEQRNEKRRGKEVALGQLLGRLDPTAHHNNEPNDPGCIMARTEKSSLPLVQQTYMYRDMKKRKPIGDVHEILKDNEGNHGGIMNKSRGSHDPSSVWNIYSGVYDSYAVLILCWSILWSILYWTLCLQPFRDGQFHESQPLARFLLQTVLLSFSLLARDGALSVAPSLFTFLSEPSL
ncbi:hypothetical protein I7I53_10536 [Histoplasma capsulatum var. duboisii H88]|uniref:Uncharacterized protein n=1 Tax=Ajellomyces capsulatus (strain H88) TaxID=544711 RepID=A0A8A1L7P8_AJEC8|nr:hypothetical protein I7I53_10536 [Histoplasma capsulatum var. duboisii H88]